MSFLETDGESHPTQFMVGSFSVLTKVVTCLLIFSSTPTGGWASRVGQLQVEKID
jgi:hypothetical protein